MANANETTTITIDGVKITLERNFYNLLGVKPKASEDEIKSAAYYLLGELLYKREKTLKLSTNPNSDVQDIFEAYYILTDPKAKAAYDLAYENDETEIKITINGKSIDTSKDFYGILGIDKGKNPEFIKDAFYKNLGKIFIEDSNRLNILNSLSDDDKSKLADIEDAYKILGVEKNRQAYDSFLKIFSSKKKVKSVENSETSKKSAKKGRGILKKVGIGALVALILAGTIAATLALSKLFGNKDSKNNIPDPNPSYSQDIDDGKDLDEEGYSIDANVYDNPNDDVKVTTRANKIINSLNTNGVSLEIYDEKTMGMRAITASDIEGLLYWCSFMSLDNNHVEKACDMDTAAMLISQLCANYEMKGETSQRIAGISGLPTDPNAGTYSLDYGSFFIDGSLQQQILSEVSSQNNSIKNNPTSASQSVAATMFKDATLQFAFDDGKMPLYSDECDTANFFYGMIMMANQSIFDLHPSFEYDGATFNDYNVFIKHLNEVDGPLNMLGRSIEKNMDDKLLLELNN